MRRWPLVPVLILVLITSVTGCYDFKIDNFPEWCGQTSDATLEDKYRPFWAVIFAVSTDADAIRDDFTDFVNKSLREKVENRSPQMAWREGTSFHLINPSALMVAEPEPIINEWRDGIEQAKTHSHRDKHKACLYGTAASLFDSMNIHTIELDPLGRQTADTVTIIQTDRALRAKDGLKPT